MYLQKLFLVAILVSVCTAKCINTVVSPVGTIPCDGVTPGFGIPGIGGGAGGFNGLGSQYVRKLNTNFGLNKICIWMKATHTHAECEAANTGNGFSISRFPNKFYRFEFCRQIVNLLSFFVLVDSGTRPILPFASNPDEEQGTGITSIHQVSGWSSHQNWNKRSKYILCEKRKIQIGRKK